MRMCLAEAGYPDWYVRWLPDERIQEGWGLHWQPIGNPAIDWQAAALALPARSLAGPAGSRAAETQTPPAAAPTATAPTWDPRPHRRTAEERT